MFVQGEHLHPRGDLDGQGHDRLVPGIPAHLQDLTPHYISANLLTDPWGNAYKYLQRPERYLVIGFAPDGKADTDLFLSRAIDTGPSTPQPTQRPDTGGSFQSGRLRAR